MSTMISFGRSGSDILAAMVRDCSECELIGLMMRKRSIYVLAGLMMRIWSKCVVIGLAVKGWKKCVLTADGDSLLDIYRDHVPIKCIIFIIFLPSCEDFRRGHQNSIQPQSKLSQIHASVNFAHVRLSLKKKSLCGRSIGK